MIDELLERPQFTIPQSEKEQLLLAGLNLLSSWHKERCAEYASLLRGIGRYDDEPGRMAEVPYVPVGLFKSHLLKSIPDASVFKVLTSSGTTGQQPSRIALDRETARRQTIALGRIMKSVLGGDRLPMLFIDNKQVLSDRKQFNARATAILGMMNFGRDHLFCLDQNDQLDRSALRNFLTRHAGSPFIVFGFTYMIWQHLVLGAKRGEFDLSDAVLMHGGGWKKLRDLSVTNAVYKQGLLDTVGIKHVYNYYGLVEQVGSVFVEGTDGYLSPPNFSDVIIRDPITWQETAIGETGIVQVVSLVPLSYPGHSILTEDLGIIHGIDDAPSGRKGKYFSIIGRIPNAELRGCSDTAAV